MGGTEAGCLAHAKRKFREMWVNHGSLIGAQTLKFFGEFCEVERVVADSAPKDRGRVRQECSGRWLMYSICG